MPFVTIAPHNPPGPLDPPCEYAKTDQGCYWCCSECNYDRHRCFGCGSELTHLGNNSDGTPHGYCV